MKVKVKFFTLFRLEFGISEIDIEVGKNEITIKELLKLIDKKTGKNVTEKLFGNDKKVKASAIILINGKNIFHIDGLNSKVKDSDVISLFPPGGGG